MKRVWKVVYSAGERFSESDAPRLAASMSYYALFSLLPLLLVLGALAEYALGDSEALRDRIMGWVGGGSSSMRSVVQQALEDVARRAPNPTAGIGLGVAGALFGASGVFIELDSALSRIFHQPPRRLSFFKSLLELGRDRISGFLVVLGTSVALLATTIARGAIELPSSVPGAALFGNAVSLVLGGGALTTGLALCYKVLPGTRVPWRAAWKGAGVASIALHLVREPFAWFVVNLTKYAAYGFIGGVLGLLAWFQIAACLLLYGGCVAAVTRSHEDEANAATRASAK